jgi:hypothetical protein
MSRSRLAASVHQYMCTVLLTPVSLCTYVRRLYGACISALPHASETRARRCLRAGLLRSIGMEATMTAGTSSFLSACCTAYIDSVHVRTSRRSIPVRTYATGTNTYIMQCLMCIYTVPGRFVRPSELNTCSYYTQAGCISISICRLCVYIYSVYIYR